jgi:hypothetical protein
VLILWSGAALLYALFWSWYVGFGRKVSPEQVDAAMAAAKGEELLPSQLEALNKFLSEDDGKEFYMVNALHLKEPVTESQKLLNSYSRSFMGDLLKRAGHPAIAARALSGNIENVNCERADNWSAAALVRYRSRADFAAMLTNYAGGEKHGYKLQALEKTFAFPAKPIVLAGGPRIVVLLALALIAAVLQLIIT